MRQVFLGCGLIPWLMFGQTQIDLSNQTIPATRNLKSGVTLPSTCRLGDVFAKTDAPSGQSLYVCTTANNWTYQGGLVSIFSDNVEIGARPVQNFAVGQGIIQAFSDAVTRLNLVTSVDTAVIQTRANAQSGQDLLCQSSGGSATAYACLMTPVVQSYRVGMVFHWIPDVSMTGASATLSINTLAAIPIKLHDGITNPALGDISAGRLYKVWYDGTSFRILWRNVPPESLQVERNTQAGRELRCNSSSASATTYTCGLSPALTTYTAGMVLRWLPDVNNAAGAVTLNVDGLGAKAIKQQDGLTDLAAADLVGGRLYEVWYDGTNFRILWRNVSITGLQVERNTQAGRELRCNSSSASASTYTCGLSPALTTYTTGMVLRWLPDVNNTAGAVTLNVDGLGARAIKQQDGVSDLAAADLTGGRLYEVWYDGTNFRMLSPVTVPTLNATRPSCDATMRGRIWFQPGSGVKDELSVCAANASAVYAWRILY